MNNTTWLPQRAVLAIGGADRVGFLQGLVSNDVTEAAPGRAVWAALLTPQGKWLADFFITAEAERLLVDVAAAQAGMLMQRLARYRLRARVTIEPAARLVFAGWGGPAPEHGFPDPRLPEAGWRALCPTPIPATASAEAYDLHRLALGLPDGSPDMEPERTTLLEAGFDVLHGVSWTKGCYMGQELTARTKYRGLLKRRLTPVAVEGKLPPPFTPVMAGGAEVGSMRSGRGESGLALLRIGASGPLQCGEAVLRPVPAAWQERDVMLAEEPA